MRLRLSVVEIAVLALMWPVPRYRGSRATEVHGNVPLPSAGAHFHTSLA